MVNCDNLVVCNIVAVAIKLCISKYVRYTNCVKYLKLCDKLHFPRPTNNFAMSNLNTGVASVYKVDAAITKAHLTIQAERSSPSPHYHRGKN